MKKLFFLSCILCLGLLSCGGDKPTPEPTPGPGKESENGETPTPEPQQPVAVTSVRLSQSQAELWVGDKLLLSAVVLPEEAEDKSVTWASSNPSVASVEPIEGKENSVIVTTLAEGDVTITAKAGEVTASCAITVHPVSVPYVFSIDPTQVSLPASGGSFNVTITCTGDYHVQTMSDWITETSVENKVHSFTAEANGSGEPRNGIIVFCDEVGTCIPCMVSQE